MQAHRKYLVFGAVMLIGGAELASAEGIVRIVRLQAFNAERRQPVVQLNSEAPLDLAFGAPVEFRVPGGTHRLTIATRVPADPRSTMLKREELLTVADGEEVTVGVRWQAGLIVGRHELDISRVQNQQLATTVTAIGPSPQPTPVPVAPSVPATQEPPAGKQREKEIVSVPSGSYTGAVGSGSYEGQWLDGKMHGKGKYSWTDGRTYVGDFVNGTPSGQGVYTWPDGRRYQGDVVNDTLSGRGVLSWADGRTYEGGFVNGALSGQGTYTWPDGRRYQGGFLNGALHGAGSFRYANGNRITGQFLNGLTQGVGEFTWANGDIYRGLFVNGKFHGLATITKANGETFQASFADGKLLQPSQAAPSQSRNGLLDLLGTALGAYAAGRYPAGDQSTAPPLPATAPDYECTTQATGLLSARTNCRAK